MVVTKAAPVTGSVAVITLVDVAVGAGEFVAVGVAVG